MLGEGGEQRLDRLPILVDASNRILERCVDDGLGPVERAEVAGGASDLADDRADAAGAESSAFQDRGPGRSPRCPPRWKGVQHRRSDIAGRPVRNTRIVHRRCTSVQSSKFKVQKAASIGQRPDVVTGKMLATTSTLEL